MLVIFSVATHIITVSVVWVTAWVGVSAFVRDRGQGFDRAAVPPDRRGLAESIEARLERAGGRATIVSAPGGGTEVELHLLRGAS